MALWFAVIGALGIWGVAQHPGVLVAFNPYYGLHLIATNGVTGFPETFVLDKTGRAVQWFPGPIDADSLRAAIQKAQAA